MLISVNSRTQRPQRIDSNYDLGDDGCLWITPQNDCTTCESHESEKMSALIDLFLMLIGVAYDWSLPCLVCLSDRAQRAGSCASLVCCVVAS